MCSGRRKGRGRERVREMERAEKPEIIVDIKSEEQAVGNETKMSSIRLLISEAIKSPSARHFHVLNRLIAHQ